MNWTFPLQVTVVLFHPTDHLVAAVAIELLCAWRQTECVEQLGSIETLDLVAVSAGYPQDIPRMSPGCPQDVPRMSPISILCWLNHLNPGGKTGKVLEHQPIFVLSAPSKSATPISVGRIRFHDKLDTKT